MLQLHIYVLLITGSLYGSTGDCLPRPARAHTLACCERRDEERERREWERGPRDSRYDPYGPPRPGYFDDYDEHPRGGRAFDAYGSAPRGGGMYDYPPPPPPRRPGYEREGYERYERPAERYDRPADRYERPADRYERPAGYSSRFADYDASLIPPPPPPRPPARDVSPPPPAPPQQQQEEDEEEDPERAAFEAELRNLQAEMSKVGKGLGIARWLAVQHDCITGLRWNSLMSLMLNAEEGGGAGRGGRPGSAAAAGAARGGLGQGRGAKAGACECGESPCSGSEGAMTLLASLGAYTVPLCLCAAAPAAATTPCEASTSTSSCAQECSYRA